MPMAVLLLLPALAGAGVQETPAWMRLVESLRPPRFKADDIAQWPYAQPLAGLCDAGAAALLESFVDRPEALGLKSPLDRLLLQRSLWACFDAHVRSWTYVQPKQAKPDRMLGLLARLIGKTAPKAADLASIPDPYHRTVAGASAPPAAFDPAAPERGFLPPDLRKEDGPWVSLGSSTETPMAAEHLSFFGGRSAFLIFVRAPEGRKESLALVERLCAHFAKRGDPIPSLPAGMQAVLLEQNLAVTAEGTIVASPLVERVELRVNVAPHRVTQGLESVDAQRFFAYRLRTDLLRSGDAAPLRALTAAEEDWEPTFTLEFGSMGANDRFPRMEKCASCHRRTHAETFGFYAPVRVGAQLAGGRRVPALVPPEEERARVIRWKQKDVTWTELQARLK